jgi:hypothetical protein
VRFTGSVHYGTLDMTDTLSWFWVIAAVVLPLALAVLVAWPFWGRSRDSLGSGVGAIVLFTCALAFVGREYIHIQQVTEWCIEAERVCRFSPEPIMRFSLYGLIAMVQAGALFAISGTVEHRMGEHSSYAKEWRR